MNKSILIVGASSKASIGYAAAQALQDAGCAVMLANRSGRLGATVLDITNQDAVYAFAEGQRFGVIVVTAGLYGAVQKEYNRMVKVEGYRHLRAAFDCPIVVVGGLCEQPNPKLQVCAEINKQVREIVERERRDLYVEIGNISGSTCVNLYEAEYGLLACDMTLSDCGRMITEAALRLL